MHKVLIVDDEKVSRLAFAKILREEGFSVAEVSGGRQAVKNFEKENPSAVLLDFMMPDMNGAETMRELKKINAGVPVIIVTGYGDIPTAVEMIKLGAYDFIVKPPKIDRLIFTLKRAIEKSELEKKVTELDRTLESSLEYMFGASQSAKTLIEQIRLVASSEFTIIIQGETGTGKTTVARSIHNLSKRAKMNFVALDIGSLPDSLAESELFGYEKGAFTGADKKKKGLFETASGGTIFIDELQNASPYMQTKILRAVEQKVICPLGGLSSIPVNVRIIAAINKNVNEAVRDKNLREDLFFRLGEFIMSMPPLRERTDDILYFSHRFYIEACKELNKPIGRIHEDTIDLLKSYPWPGNIRELNNVIRRATLFSYDKVLKPEDIDFLIGTHNDNEKGISLMPLKEVSAIAVRDVESRVIKQALANTDGNKTKAAAILQIDYKTLLTKIKEYGIQ